MPTTSQMEVWKSQDAHWKGEEYKNPISYKVGRLLTDDVIKRDDLPRILDWNNSGGVDPIEMAGTALGAYVLGKGAKAAYNKIRGKGKRDMSEESRVEKRQKKGYGLTPEAYNYISKLNKNQLYELEDELRDQQKAHNKAAGILSTSAGITGAGLAASLNLRDREWDTGDTLASVVSGVSSALLTLAGSWSPNAAKSVRKIRKDKEKMGEFKSSNQAKRLEKALAFSEDEERKPSALDKAIDYVHENKKPLAIGAGVAVGAAALAQHPAVKEKIEKVKQVLFSEDEKNKS